MQAQGRWVWNWALRLWGEAYRKRGWLNRVGFWTGCCRQSRLKEEVNINVRISPMLCQFYVAAKHLNLKFREKFQSFTGECFTATLLV